MKRLICVVGGQYGSEGKGAITGHIAKREGEARRDVTVVRVAGPNAGHTAYDQHGRKWALRQVPVGAVTNEDAALVIAQGSEIDLPVLVSEVDNLELAGIKIRNRLLVHGEATMIHHRHKATEVSLVGAIGSTGKGIGAARADRLLRKATLARDERVAFQKQGIQVTNQTRYALAGVGSNSTVIIEGTQGYGLGLHAGHYPQCTSSDCTAIDFLSMAGINPWGWDLQVVVVARAFPIRVAGNSGPLKGETTWSRLGLDEELTTVTQKVRRVGQWDGDLVRDAVRANGGGSRGSKVVLALTMADQVFPKIHGRTCANGLVAEWAAGKEAEVGAKVHYIGTSPTTVIDWSK